MANGSIMPSAWGARLKSLWSLQHIRYLFTGGANTLLNYAIGAALFYVLVDSMHYIFIMIITTITCVTISFLSHKKIVFRTEGNFVREYFRFYVIYALPICFGFVAFPFLYDWLGMNPYVAQALIMAVTVVASYFGHRRYTFRAQQESGN